MSYLLNPYLFGGPDPLDNVVLLVSFNGDMTDRSNSAHTLTPSGGAVVNGEYFPIITNQQHSADFDGSGDYVTVSDSDDFHFGSGDFTVEGWLRHESTATDGVLCQWGASNRGWAFFDDGNALVEFFWSTNGTDSNTLNYNHGANTNTWVHVAASRVGNTLYLCYDEVIRATADVTGVTFNNSTRPLVFGANSDGSSANYSGQLAEWRITKGEGRYSGSVSDAISPGGQFLPYDIYYDSDFSSVVLLLLCDGADTSTTFTDSSDSAHSITANGDAQHTTTNAPDWQSTSATFDGTGDYLSASDDADWDLGSGDFTIEYFARNPDASAGKAIISQWGATDRGWAIIEGGGNFVFHYSTNGTNETTVTGSAGSGSWAHRAVSRVGNTLYMVSDGVVRATADVTGVTINNSTRSLILGATNGGSSNLYDGLLASVRITKGVGRYSGSVNDRIYFTGGPLPTSAS